jgi:hypothetical protein
MAISDNEIIAELTGDGAKLEDHFLIDTEICVVNRNGELMTLIIEDLPGENSGERYLAILEFLQRRGAKSYRSHTEYNQQTKS